MLVDRLKMPTTYCYASSSPGEISVSDGEVEGPDYLLSSTVRLDESFFQVLGECGESRRVEGLVGWNFEGIGV